MRLQNPYDGGVVAGGRGEGIAQRQLWCCEGGGGSSAATFRISKDTIFQPFIFFHLTFFGFFLRRFTLGSVWARQTAREEGGERECEHTGHAFTSSGEGPFRVRRLGLVFSSSSSFFSFLQKRWRRLKPPPPPASPPPAPLSNPPPPRPAVHVHVWAR